MDAEVLFQTASASELPEAQDNFHFRRSELGLPERGVPGGSFGQHEPDSERELQNSRDFDGDQMPQQERRFSVSLQDLSDVAANHIGTQQRHRPSQAARGPGDFEGNSAFPAWLQERNPLESISSHWGSAHGLWASISSLWEQSQTMPAAASPRSPGTGVDQEEIRKAEGRAFSLHAKIDHLEAVAAAQPKEGRLQIVVAGLLDGDKLGISFQGMAVQAVNDSRAFHHGWAVGDQVLQVNGARVTNMQELSAAIAGAIQANQCLGRPLQFEVWRHPVRAPAGLRTAPATQPFAARAAVEMPRVSSCLPATFSSPPAVRASPWLCASA